MKKSIFTFGAGILLVSIVALGFVKYNGSESSDQDFEFIYDVQNRFSKTIIKDKLNQALSVNDVLPEKDTKNIASFHNIMVTRFAELRRDWISATCEKGVFNKEQIKMLKALDHGSSFSITGNIRKVDEADGSVQLDTIIHYMSTIPNIQAKYDEGQEALITYLKENSKKAISIAKKDKIQPGKISFKVTEKGNIDHLKLNYTSGYDSIDEKMFEVVKDIPGNWKVAKNAKGEKVAQEFTFFFGQVGC